MRPINTPHVLECKSVEYPDWGQARGVRISFSGLASIKKVSSLSVITIILPRPLDIATLQTMQTHPPRRAVAAGSEVEQYAVVLEGDHGPGCRAMGEGARDSGGFGWEFECFNNLRSIASLYEIYLKSERLNFVDE